MTDESEYVAHLEAIKEGNPRPPKKVMLSAANKHAKGIELVLETGSFHETFVMPRNVAAHLISDIAKALAQR